MSNALRSSNQSKQESLSSSVEGFFGHFSEDMKLVNKIILDNMQSDVAIIPQLASYLIAAGGKRLRPILTLASTSLFTDNIEGSYGLAASVEFIHTATLLHDDVVDGSEQRRGQKAANLVFGNQTSVLVGDFLFSKAFQLMVESKSLDVLRILSDASAIIAEGEVLQLQAQGQIDTSWDTYLDIIGAKTAALFAAACEIGPWIAEKPEYAEGCYNYGYNLGLAFQIADDILDYSGNTDETGKNTGDDFYDGKATAPVLIAIEHATEEEKIFWNRTIGQQNFEEGDFEKALELTSKYNACEIAEQRAREYAQKAVKSLPQNNLSNPVYEGLLALPEYAVARKK